MSIGTLLPVILNAFSILAAFAAALRALLGILAAAAGIRALRARRGGTEEGYYLAFTATTALVALGLASWPLLYLVLQSFVPEWPDVMCVYGVTRIGAGSVGPAAWLPPLVTMLEILKPAVVFAGGAWLVLHLANRGERTGALSRRVLAAAVACGALSVADAGAEVAYLSIPKKERFLATGCCSIGPGVTTKAMAAAGPSDTTALSAAFWSLSVAVVGTVTLALRGLRRGAPSRVPLALSVAGAAASLPLGVAFLGAVAAPAFLGRPGHACPYCLIPDAPEGLAPVLLYAGGAFAAGWAGVAIGLAREGSGRAHGARLLRFARLGYVAALAIVAARLLFP